jgi:hypothetical protein
MCSSSCSLVELLFSEKVLFNVKILGGVQLIIWDHGSVVRFVEMFAHKGDFDR